VIGVLLIWLGLTQPTLGATCRQTASHQICLLKIERSAKHYWEYWAVVSVDGVVLPKTVYNCRDQTSTAPRQGPARFVADGPGPLVCKLYRAG
jgi:hypothetical protein